MEYIKQIVRNDTQARFGVINTTGETYKLPVCSPMPRTKAEARAVMRNIASGLNLEVITPPMSRRREITAELGGLLGLVNTVQEVSLKKPLVVPDIESEALNFSCVARSKFFQWNKDTLRYEAETAISDLANCGLSGDDNVHSIWKSTVKKFGYVPILNWYSRSLTAIASDVLVIPTPIIRANTDTVRLAIEAARTMIPLAKLEQKFAMQGVHFLLHGDFFTNGYSAEEARKKLIEEVRTWKMSDTMSNLFLSFKVHDPNGVLTHGTTGNSARRNLSDFTLELHEATEASGGILVAHNWGNWSLGLLYSGADIVSFRLDGKRDIERIYRRRKGSTVNLDVPQYMIPRALVDFHYKELMREYNRTNGFPCSSYIEPEPYWTFPKRTDQLVYTAAERFGVLFELGDEFRNAGLDESISIPEAVRSRVLDSQIIQELSDLCQSI